MIVPYVLRFCNGYKPPLDVEISNGALISKGVALAAK
jgi:hypothetical protein